MRVADSPNIRKRATLRQVSEAAGVSIQTASHVLSPRFRSRYRKDTQDKVIAAAAKLGYRPNFAARAMLSSRSHLIGVVVPSVRSGWFSRLDMFETIMGMNEVLAEADYVTSVIPIGRLRAGRASREQLFDGVAVISGLPDDLRAVAEAMAPVIVWCNTNVDLPQGCVLRDEIDAGEQVAGNLVRLGYRKFLWVTYAIPSGHYSNAARVQGITRVAATHGVAVETIAVTESFLGPEAEGLLAELAPDVAVITENHHFAQSVVNVAAAAGKRPGVDYGLAACDHSYERATVLPGLSRMVVDRARLGEITAEMLLSGLRDGVLPPSTVVRGTWFEGTTTRKLN